MLEGTTAHPDTAARGRPLRARALRIAVGAAAIIAGLGVAELRRGAIELVVDADIDSGSFIEFFHNDLWGQSQQLPLQAGRRLYRFQGLPAHLWSLRLDPTDTFPARVRLYQVRIERRGEPLRVFGPSEMRAWTAWSLGVLPAGGDAVEFAPTTADPMLLVPGDFDYYGRGPSAWLQTLLQTPAQLIAAFYFVFLLAGVFPWRGVKDAIWPAMLPAAGALILVTWRAVVTALDQKLGGIASAARAVGSANYLGYPKLSDLRLHMLAVAFCAVLGLIAGLLISRLEGREPAQDPAGEQQQARAPAAFCAALVLLCALGIFPPLSSFLRDLLTGVHRPTYDETNLLTWQYLVHRGWRPFRDFWYTYGWFWSFDFGGWFPWGFLRSWLHQLLLIAIAAWSISRLHRARPRVGAAILVAFLGGLAFNFFPAAGRYFLALDLGLLALVARQERYSLRPLLALAALAVYTFLFEATQLIYAGLPLAMIAVTDVWTADAVNRRALLRRLGVGSAAAAGGILLVLGALWRSGQLEGFVAFLDQLDAMTIYCAVPADWNAWLQPDGTALTVILWGPLCLLAMAGLWIGLRRQLTPAAAATIMFGLIGATVFNKFLVRPHIAPQLSAYSVTGALLALPHLLPRLRAAQRTVLIAACAVLAVHLLDDLPRKSALTNAWPLISLPVDVAALAQGVPAGAELAYYEDQRRYPSYEKLIERLKQLMPKDENGLRRETFYDFGDDSALYLALQQKPPYYISFYNSSPLDAQRATLAWLDLVKPRWVVYRPGFTEFDGVPHLVRVPLLFQAVASAYVPFERIGDFEILERRADETPPDFDFWSSRLGPSLDLGAVPGVSGLDKARSCVVEPCVQALRLTVESPVGGRRRTLPVTVEGHRFDLGFRELAHQHDYYLHLGRLWFYGLLARGGLEPHVSAEAGPGAKVTQIRLASEPEVLW